MLSSPQRPKVPLLEAYDFMLVGCNCPGVHHPGEYRSPIPSFSRIKAQRHRAFIVLKELPGVDLNLAGRRTLGMEIAPFVAGCPFPQTRPDLGGITARMPGSPGMMRSCCMA
jgi:hypothetical protein